MAFLSLIWRAQIFCFILILGKAEGKASEMSKRQWRILLKPKGLIRVRQNVG